MNKKLNRIMSGAVAATLAMGSTVIPAFAAPVSGNTNVGPGGAADTTAQTEKKHEMSPEEAAKHGTDKGMGFWVDKDSVDKEEGGKVYRKSVKPLGKNAFYRIENNETADAANAGDKSYSPHIVEYSVGNDGTKSNAQDEWHAIPSAYVNDGFKEDSLYGAYVVENGEGGKPEVVFVKLDECVKEADGSYTFGHATADGALVSGEVDTADSKDPSMGTDFFLRVDNNFKPEAERVEPDFARADKWVSYDIDVAIETKYNLEATIPMYVCMYGYRATGEVVTPTKDQYVMKNYSSINYGNKAYIKDVRKHTIYTPVFDQDHSNEKIHTIVYMEDLDMYAWFYGAPTVDDIKNAMTQAGSANADKVVSGDEDFIHCFDANDDGKVGDGEEYITASAESFVYFDAVARTWSFKSNGVLEDIVGEDGKIYRGTTESFMVENDQGVKVPGVDPNHPLKAPFTHTTKLHNGDAQKDFTFNFDTTTPKVGDTASNPAKDEALAIRVSELQATPASWKLVPFGTQNMKAGELGMKIAPAKANKDVSAIDLSTCSAPVDITDRGWLVDAPSMQTEGTVDRNKPGELPLITMARMAGSNVNPVGCTSVVHVEYTITPNEVLDDVQVNTDQAGTVENNHLPEVADKK